ncbi:MAG: o-succinylbenzoate synthase [Verrucomicrobia bacterium CG_4_10_14_3_um_filter_43_23]|nr:MAG: o-succinylbenzoate synthase [Verrucomicrobia bacterium CG1_02_43_26]PIP59699.1 MAG: o-succinylbenzoate synthase [Verrucomicrobia bacterium CG22_combo_CG10-13_8_21_14_all_43_17]PIX57711.1 MAG: o-succinylbenzoate synthase [Verrucomicrobia bacterium CG_4_10_14_3_um_filter_43_23]PIY62503.1 MAG: o-succinylbenzoate synthase [Verrucomicrobia bacterium CG_4_10_14_0_8_um_filter_43_34]PJA44677.1 MAG: o-succinylbenzoate synthase [Verrucomicrobia bacterium CG_4_9_14_3_um_filter_43_20]
MKFGLKYKPYRRRFTKPLKSPSGLWKYREGIIIQLTDPNGRRGYGEIAPLEWFGTESIAEAIKLLDSFSGNIDANAISAGWGTYPCSTFGLRAAIGDFQQKKERKFETVILVGSTTEGLKRLEEGIKHLKLKLTREAKEIELEGIKELVSLGAKARLDPNGGLSMSEFMWWMEALEELQGIEFLEQPLNVGLEREMIAVSQNFKTTIALDESIGSIKDILELEKSGFKGLYVAKPSTMGDLDRVGELDDDILKRMVYSTVLESSIGIEASLGAIPAICDHKVGFGTSDFFERDGMYCHGEGCELYYGRMTEAEKEEIWTRARWK